MSQTHTLILLRHGQSQWNLENRFTGWVDVDLTPEGMEEAKRAAAALKKAKLSYDCAHTSYLKRAIRTLWTVMDEMERMWVPVQRSWRLNERHYGALQGLNKSEMAEKYGEEQVQQWRRGFDVAPPLLEDSDRNLPRFEERYQGVDPQVLPRGESLKQTIQRIAPYWEESIVPDLKNGKRVLVVAHGNSLRALMKHLEGLSEEAITGVNIPTALPLVYHLKPTPSGADFEVVRSEYLGDPEEVRKLQEAVAQQGQAKPSSKG